MAKIQKQGVKTEAELISGGSNASDLINDTQIYVSASGVNKTLDDTLVDGDLTAKRDLSNLTSPTAVNQDLNLATGKNILLKNNALLNALKADGTTVVPIAKVDTSDVCVLGTGSGQTVRINAGILSPTSNGNDLGTAALAWDIFINNVLSDIKISGTRTIQSIDSTSSATLTMSTGAASAGSSGNLTLRTGDATTTSGNVVLQAGAVAGVRANVNILASSLDTTGVNLFKLLLPRTITAGGTTGNQTINRISGTVNFAAAATSLTVTNSLVDASSIVMAVVRTNDATATIKNVVSAAGSFTINLNAAATAETSVGFFVLN